MYSHNSGQMLTHQPPRVWEYSLEGINMKDFMLIFCLILQQKSFKRPYFTILSASFQESGSVKETQFIYTLVYFAGWCRFYHYLYIENLQFKYSYDSSWLS